jgi:hypothetical protein
VEAARSRLKRTTLGRWRKRLKGIRVWAVVVGLLDATATAMILRFIAALVLGGLFHQPVVGVPWWILSLLLAALAAGTGGFVAARMSPANRLGAALLVGLLEMPLAAWFLFSPAGTAWTWWMSTMYLMALVVGALGGGYLVVRATAQQARPADSMNL